MYIYLTKILFIVLNSVRRHLADRCSNVLVVGRGSAAGFSHKITICFAPCLLSLHQWKQTERELSFPQQHYRWLQTLQRQQANPLGQDAVDQFDDATRGSIPGSKRCCSMLNCTNHFVFQAVKQQQIQFLILTKFFPVILSF